MDKCLTETGNNVIVALDQLHGLLSHSLAHLSLVQLDLVQLRNLGLKLLHLGNVAPLQPWLESLQLL